jgi:hypothetical protein
VQRFSRAEAGEEAGRAEVVVMVRDRRMVRRWVVRETIVVLMLEVLVGWDGVCGPWCVRSM